MCYRAVDIKYVTSPKAKFHSFKCEREPEDGKSEIDNSDDMSKSSTHPETFVIINSALNAPLMLISIIGNTLVLVAILRTPSLRAPSFTLLGSLAVSDLLAGLVVQPLYVAYELTENPSLFHARSTMVLSVCGASVLTITAISVDRFLALHYHMRYPDLMTTQRASYALAVIWFVCFLLSLFSFWKTNIFYFSFAVIIAICVLTSTVCYARIYRILRQHQLQIHTQQQAVQNFNPENLNLNIQRSIKSAINAFIYYIVMILYYTPAFISVSIYTTSSDHWSNAWVFAETVAFMNSSINPFLSCWRIRELRRAVVKTARRLLCKQTEEN